LASFRFDGKLKSPKVMEKKLNRAVYGIARYYDGRMEAHAKQKAPWKDRTSNARNGLSSQVTKWNDGYAIILSHAVTYGIYLELGHHHEVALKKGGVSVWDVKPYPIIMPTIDLFAPRVMKKLRKLLDRL
jgi:hypothetical protein